MYWVISVFPVHKEPDASIILKQTAGFIINVILIGHRIFIVGGSRAADDVHVAIPVQAAVLGHTHQSISARHALAFMFGHYNQLERATDSQKATVDSP